MDESNLQPTGGRNDLVENEETRLQGPKKYETELQIE
jgi:hypothetical protein